MTLRNVLGLFLVTAALLASYKPLAAGRQELTANGQFSAASGPTGVLRDQPLTPSPQPLVVSPSGPYTTIVAALSEARYGDTIEVHGGAHPALVVETAGVTLSGVDWPVIDGGGQGTVVALNAPEIVFRGFVVRGSGNEPDRDHSGITLNAARIRVENNRLEDVLFGLFIAQADGAVVRGNDVTSRASNDEARRGDGIRVWYSQGVTVEGNVVHEARDVVAWYSQDLILRENVITRGRYGVHLMYTDGALVERNQLHHNSVGIYTMYSRNVQLIANDLRGHRGPSGYALGFKDADNVTITGNLLADNRGGVFLDGTPFSPQGYSRFENNILAFNDVGVILTPAVRGNLFAGNTFWENVEQMAVQGGGGRPEANTWRGNYWSDYAGYDADGDGVGEVPYRAERFFESLTEREPMLRAFIYSPASQAIEFAGAALPIFRPQPKLVDSAPRLEPAPLPLGLVPPNTTPLPMLAVGLGLLGVSALCAVSGGRMPKPTRMATTVMNAENEGRIAEHATASTLTIHNVSKRYGQVAALDGISFEAQPGEALALWGANGAGKTTLLKAILGLIDFQGAITVQGRDVKREGKAARRFIGYVPQDVNFYDMSVQATLEFYARLKERTESGDWRFDHQSTIPNPQSPTTRIPALLARLGLAEHAHKPVPALSGGLRQRLALAIALLADPPVLLLDEPTANLDARAQRDYLTLLRRLCRDEGKTIIFASHRLEEVELLASRVLLLEHGRLVDVLSPVDLLARLMPYVTLTLWVPEAQRPEALARFTGQGFNAHLNGRGTVVVQVRAEEKMHALRLMSEMPVTNFEMTPAWEG